MFHNFLSQLFYPSYYKTNITETENPTNESLEKLLEDIKLLCSDISRVKEDISFIKNELENKNIIYIKNECIYSNAVLQEGEVSPDNKT